MLLAFLELMHKKSLLPVKVQLTLTPDRILEPCVPQSVRTKVVLKAVNY